jgi:hypothetical protein
VSFGRGEVSSPSYLHAALLRQPLGFSSLSPASTGRVGGESPGPDGTAGVAAQSPCIQARVRAKVQHMEDGYTQLGTVLIDQRPEDSEGDGVIAVGRFKGGPYDGVQLSCEAGRRNVYLTPEGALRLAFLLAAAVERDIDIR